MSEELQMKRFEMNFKDEDEFSRFVSYMNRTFGHGRENWSAGSKRYSIAKILRQRRYRISRSISITKQSKKDRSNEPFPIRVKTDMEVDHLKALIKLSI